jgi:hypothetical protein
MSKNIENWAETQFEGLDLGDKRLNKRAQLIASNMIKKPSVSINMQSENWSESKGAYRLFDSKKVSFQELIKPHTKLVKSKANSLELVLAIQDTCYISYGHHKSVTDLGHIGAEGTSGIILHNTLAVNPSPKHPSVIGVLDQWIHNRMHSKEEDWKETKLWQEASSRINIDVTKTKVVEVMDREGSAFDIMKHSLSLRHEFLIRAKSNKYVKNPFKHQIIDAGLKITAAGYIKIDVQKKEGQKKRKAKLEVKFLPIEVPGHSGRKDESINCNLVQVVEVKPPKNQEPLSWYLLTSVEVNSLEDALKIIEWYKYRWIIEEYHKCIKTGCNVQSKQLRSSFRIENYLGIAGIIAVKLLEIRDLMRVNPDELASKVIDPLSLKIIQNYHKIKKELTIKEFYILVAKMGGFLNRKSDSNPGWQTLWKGQLQLFWMVEGAKEMLDVLKTYG